MENIKRIILTFSLLLLVACNSTKVEAGPSIGVANVAQVGLHLNSEGEFVLAGGVSIPVILLGPVSVNLDAAFETTLNEAKKTSNYLYILWELGDGSIERQAYDISQPFDITFENEQWVRRISHVGDGNIVVYVEIRDLGTETFPCGSYAVNTRLRPGMNARVTTTDNHLSLRIRTLPITESSTYITSLDEETTMRVVDGPACNKGWVWWNVTTKNGYTGWVSEGDGTIWFIEPIE